VTGSGGILGSYFQQSENRFLGLPYVRSSPLANQRNMGIIMQLARKSSIWGCLMAAAAGAIAPHAASAADGIKAAYVETVIPSKSYSGTAAVSYFQSTATFGPAQTGVLGIGNITLTNTDIVPLFVYIGVPTLGGSSCGTSTYTGYSGTLFSLYVQPQSTLVIPFPTPYVVNSAGGQACLAIQSGGFSLDGQLNVFVTGLLN
jgi:hypothetical protein